MQQRGTVVADDEPWVQLATRIPKSLQRRLKLHCVETDTKLMHFLVQALPEKLKKDAGRRRGAKGAPPA
jgi:hypothetical protein